MCVEREYRDVEKEKTNIRQQRIRNKKKENGKQKNSREKSKLENKRSTGCVTGGSSSFYGDAANGKEGSDTI